MGIFKNLFSGSAKGFCVRTLVFVAGVLSFCSCIYDNLNTYCNDLTVRVRISVPGETPSTRSSVSFDGDGNNLGPEAQRNINDLYALIFNEEGTSLIFALKMSLVSGASTDESQVYDASISLDEKMEATIWLVTNVEQNGFSASDMQGLCGKSKAEVQAALVFPYDYSSNDDGTTLSGWDISQHSLPMWGEATTSSGGSVITLDPSSGTVQYVYSSLYRAVAKMGFTIAASDDNAAVFNLREVYVYYAKDNGAVAPGLENVPDSDWQYLTPDVPSSASTLGSPIKYDLGGGYL